MRCPNMFLWSERRKMQAGIQYIFIYIFLSEYCILGGIVI